MDVDVELAGLTELRDRLAHAHDGILDLSRDLAAILVDAAPPMVVVESPRMRARPWGTGDVWTLPAGGWIQHRIRLPDKLETLTDHVQQLLDGH